MSVIKFPQRNLAPEANNWARSIEKVTQELSQKLTEYQQSMERAMAGINQSLNGAVKVDAHLAGLQQNIDEIGGSLSSVQAEIGSTIVSAESANQWEIEPPTADDVPDNPNGAWYVIDPETKEILEVWTYEPPETIEDEEEGELPDVGELEDLGEPENYWVQQKWGMSTLPEDIDELIKDVDHALTVELPDARERAQEAQSKAIESLNKANALAEEAVVEYEVQYALGTSTTVAPTSGWSTAQPVWSPGEYVWFRSLVTYGNDDTATTAPALLTGPEGAKGDKGLGVESLTTYFASFSTEWAGTEGASESTLKMGGEEVAKNYSIRSRGIQTWNTNNPTTNPLQSNQPVPAPHPLGIDTANKQTSTGTTYNLGTLYNIDGTFNAWDGVTPTLHRGAWVYVNASGYMARLGNTGPWHPVPTNTWTFVRSDGAKASTLLFVMTESGELASTTDAVWFTGSIASDQPIPYFDGSTQPYLELVEGFMPPEHDWSTQPPPYDENAVLYETLLVDYDNGQYAYTEPTLNTDWQAAKQALHVANLAQAFAEGLLTIGEEPPEHGEGRVWLSTDADGNLTGIYQSVDGAWATYTIITGVLIVPGEDGNPTVIDQNGMVVGTVTADSITGEVIAAETIGARHLVLAEIGSEYLTDGVNEDLDAANAWSKLTLLEPGKITISQAPIGAANKLTALILQPTKLDFVVEDESRAYIDSERNLMSIENVYVRDTAQIGQHQVKTLPGTNITIFNWTGE